MRTLGDNVIWSYKDDQPDAQKIKNATTIRGSKGHTVHSYMELATKVAELQFRNPDFVLLFRGQTSDYLNKNRNTTLKPSLFRSERGNKPPNQDIVSRRFATLIEAERELLQQYKLHGHLGVEQLEKYRILRWAILQHYEVCATPLLDVTQSLRIAASFGSEELRESRELPESAYIFVLAVPNLSGAITANAEAGLQIIRLASVCPPSAVRPHIQEGYLLGEYPDMLNWDQKVHYEHHEIDFGRRLIGKFCINPRKFWQDRLFPRVESEALYPPESEDPLFQLANRVKQYVNP